MGDATGHGASAALITASVHSAFSLMIAELQRVKKILKPDTEILSILSNSLNQALLLTAGEQSTFPALLAVIDLESLKMWTFNAGHPKPYLFRAGTKQYEAIAAESSIPLGQKAFKFEPKLSMTELKPGDQVLWYTDGLFDARVSDGKKMKKKVLLDEIKGKIDLISKNISKPGSSSLADFVLAQTQQFFGSSNTNQSDDITVLSILVPISSNSTPAPSNQAA
jgi:sigma-B regulation protein RsbU (phosphoserine phosphatase)